MVQLLSALSPLCQFTQTAAGQVEFFLGRLTRLLLKDMQDINSLTELGDLKHTRLKPRVNTQLRNPQANTGHGFPVVRLRAQLHEVQLVPSDTSGFLRKHSEVIASSP